MKEIMQLQIKKEIEDYIKHQDVVMLLDNIKSVFLSNCDLKELMETYQFINLPTMGAIFFYNDKSIRYDCTPLIINVNENYRKMLNDKGNKMKIAKQIMDNLKEQNYEINNDTWIIAKFKSKFVLIEFDSSEAMLNRIKNTNKIKDDRIDNSMKFTELTPNEIWDATI